MRKKIKKVTKKVMAKKKAPKRKASKQSSALAVISMSELATPEVHSGKYSILKSYFPNRLIKFITEPTPAHLIYQRDGTGGMKFDYVPGWYAKKRLNYALGFNQSFEIKSKEIVGMSAVVEGRLSIKDPKTGKEILYKDDIGGHTIQFLSGKAKTPENAVNIANDYKSAATDALKRCMHQVGFFSDIYGKAESHENNVVVKNGQKDDMVDVEVVDDNDPRDSKFECHDCGNPMSEAEVQYSKKFFKGKQFCRTCQNLHKQK